MSMEECDTYQGDPSEWIPLKAIHDYVDKAVKAGRKVWNGRSIIAGEYDKLPIQWLHQDKQFISDSQFDSAINFNIICNCVVGRISPFGVSDSLQVPYATAVMKKTAIESQLKPEDKHLIRRIIIYPVFIADYRQFAAMPKRIYDVFSALEDAMQKDNILKAIDFIRDKAKMLKGSRATDPSKFSYEIRTS
jgi:hypothetical protein